MSVPNAQARGSRPMIGLPWPSTFPRRAWHVPPIPGWAVAFGAFVILFLRRPETLMRAEFWADDGSFYEDALRYGLTTLDQAYAGYQVFVQRVVALVEAAVPPLVAPTVGNAAMLAATALVAGLLASSRMALVVTDRRWRIGLAIVFAMLPATSTVIGSLANVQWVVAVYLVVMAAATVPTSRMGRMGDAFGLLAAGLTGPFSIILLPIYAVRAWFDGRRVWHLVWLAVPAAIQIATLLTAPRREAYPLELALVPEIVAMRVIVEPLIGLHGVYTFTASLLVVLACVLALVLAWMHLPRPLLAGGLYVALAIPAASLVTTSTETARFLDPLDAQRYFYLTGVVFAILVWAAVSAGRGLALPALALLMLGVALDARMEPYPTFGWAEHSACIGGREPCVVPVGPGGGRWDVEWSGQ